MPKEIFQVVKDQLLKYEPHFNSILNTYIDFEGLTFELFNYFKQPHNGFQSSIEMVSALRNHIIDKIQLTPDQHFWIINKWGLIGSFKNTEINNKRINLFIQKIQQYKDLNTDLFGVISSLSKVSSFQFPTEYFVYDSRTIFTSNWLILKSNNKNPKYFPMPESRNKRLTLFELNTIIAYKHKNELLAIYNNYSISPLLLSQKTAYFQYCNLIKYLHQYLLKDKPIWTIEILLFCLADKIIFNEVKDCNLYLP